MKTITKGMMAYHQQHRFHSIHNTVDMMLLSKAKINKIIILQHLKEEIFEQ